jgi:hypothetical protein
VLKVYGKASFDQIASEYEKAIWGENQASDLMSSRNRPYFQADDQEGFDIRIVYGPTSAYEKTSSRWIPEEEVPEQTVEVISGVQLRSLGKQIGTEQQGAPVQEMYEFIARDVNGSFL